MSATSNGIDIEIDRKQVCHYLGYGADCKPPACVSSLIDECAEHAHHLIEPCIPISAEARSSMIVRVGEI